jgi:hypothetical protein
MAAAAKDAIDLILRDPVMPERPQKAKPKKPEQTQSLTFHHTQR